MSALFEEFSQDSDSGDENQAKAQDDMIFEHVISVSKSHAPPSDILCLQESPYL